MIQVAKEIYDQIQEEIKTIPLDEFLLSPEEEQSLRSQKIQHILDSRTRQTSAEVKQRINEEMNGWGPLRALFDDESITEIIVNGRESIWIERQGQLHSYSDIFFSDVSYRNCLDRITHAANTYITKEHPCADGQFDNFRLSLVGEDLTQSATHLTLRRHPKNPWSFEKLQDLNWCSSAQGQLLNDIYKNKKNFLVIGSTGAGKTSVLNSFLNLSDHNERIVVIEDTLEIALPNKASMRLLTRTDPQGVLPEVDQSQLVKRTLRLRPDRIVMGEVRGAEAKDFLMAMATGHRGSFGTLHAQDPHQALIRLEMLIQMGAPQWSLTAIRRLIQLSLDYIIVAEKKSNGERRFKGAYKICSLEESGFLLEAVEA